MDDDTIIRQRIAGRSLRAIAKAQHCSVAQVSEAIDRWADEAITDKARKHGLALELARELGRLELSHSLGEFLAFMLSDYGC